MIRRSLIGVALTVTLSVGAGGCVATEMGPRPQRSALEIRETQTRQLHGYGRGEAMKALVDVLQDEGFMVKNAVIELGLVSAVKEVDVSETSARVMSTIIFGDEARWNKTSIMEATANVTPLQHERSGESVRVRISFQSKTLNNRGEVEAVEEVRDGAFYQSFFSKLDKALFLMRQGI